MCRGAERDRSNANEWPRVRRWSQAGPGGWTGQALAARQKNFSPSQNRVKISPQNSYFKGQNKKFHLFFLKK